MLMEFLDGHLIRGDQPLAVEFASTIHAAGGHRVDTLEHPDGFPTWVRLNQRHVADLEGLDDLATDRLDDGVAADVRRLRDAVRNLLVSAADGASPEPDDIDCVNAALRRAPSHRRIRWEADSRPQARSIHLCTPIEALAARIASDCVDALIGVHGHLVACGAPGCVLVFVTTDRRRMWCSPGCGNRARVARHYKRTRTK